MHPTTLRNQNEHTDLYAPPGAPARKTGEYDGRALWVLQKPFRENWAIQMRVAGKSVRPGGEVDLPKMLVELVRETVTDNNFGLTPESVLHIKDRRFGNWLFEWLGGYDLLGLIASAENARPKARSARSSKDARGSRTSKRASSKSSSSEGGTA